MRILLPQKRVFLLTAMKEKVMYLLVGPKGSGKSFIGTFLEPTFKFRFVRVEDRVVEIKENRQIDDETYISDALKRSKSKLEMHLTSHR